MTDNQPTEAMVEARAKWGAMIKPLEWTQADVDTSYYFAQSSIGNYSITDFPIVGDDKLTVRLLGTSQYGTWFANLQEAKAAAQADYETRILSTLQSPDKERVETPAPAEHVTGGDTYATAPIVLTEWERTRLAQHVSANALTYMRHHARGGLKPAEIEDMDRWKALSDKLQPALKSEGSADA